MPLTKDQQRVLNALKAAGRPLGAYALLDRLRQPGFKAPTQVYRALDRLVELGTVHRLETLNAYIACSHPELCKHNFTAFAICETCGHIDEFATSDLSGSLERLIKENNFAARGATIEMLGKCQRCIDLEQTES